MPPLIMKPHVSGGQGAIYGRPLQRHFSYFSLSTVFTKWAHYPVLVLAVLLYGREVWCLRGDLLAKLRSFHNRCCRAMCRITMEHTRR